MTLPRSILLTGATGALGPATCRVLLDAGVRVRALVRNTTSTLPNDAEPVVGDLSDGPSLDRAVEGCDAVVHLAALLHVVDPPPELERDYQRLNVEGTRLLAEAARTAGAKRFVFASTTAVYGPSSGPATEEQPLAPDTFYSRSKVDAERVLQGLRVPGVFDTVVLRLSAVYGPRIKGNYQRLLNALASRRFVPIGDGRHCRSLIFEDDAAAAFALAVAHAPAASGGIFNVTDGSPHELRAIIGAMCDALGRPRPRLAVPAVPVRMAAALATAACRLAGRRQPSAVAGVSKYLEPSVVDGSRLVRDLGFRAEVDLDAGWRRTVETLRHAGALPAAGRS